MSWVVSEYWTRFGLAKIGYTGNVDELDPVMLQLFGIIAHEMNRIETEQLNRGRK